MPFFSNHGFSFVFLVVVFAIFPISQQKTLAQNGPAVEANDESIIKRQYMLAEGLFDRRFFDLAEEEFRSFIEQHPDNRLALRAHFRLAECLNAQDKLEPALKTIESVEKKWPDDALTQRLLLLKANILNRTNDTDKAVETYRRIIGNPDSRLQETARYFLARLLEEKGDWEVAETLYKTLAEKEFDADHHYRPYSMFSLAAAAQQRGNLARANDLFNNLIKAKNVPGKLREEALYRYAENAFIQNRYKAALEIYDQIVVDFSDGDFVEEALKRRIWCYYSMGDFAKAIELGQEWHRQHPDSDDFEMNFVMGASLVGASLFDQATDWLARVENGVQVPDDFLRTAGYQRIYCYLRLDKDEKVLELAPEFVEEYSGSDEAVDVYYFWATALLRQERYEKAAEKLNKALQSFVAEWEYEQDARILLARCLQELDRNDEAADVLQQIAATAPPDQKAAFLLRSADAARRAGNVKLAADNYQAALVSGSLSATETRTAIARLAELYTENDDLQNAVAIFESTLPKIAPENRPQVKLLLGYLHLELKQLDQAEVILRDLLSQNTPPEIAGEARYFLADTLLQKGKTDDAVTIFSELLRLPTSERPDFSSELLFRLQELYFNRAEYQVSEKICRWLMADSVPSIRNRATLRLAEILISGKRYAEAEQVLQPLLGTTASEEQQAETAGAVLDATILMGDIHMHNGELDRAATAFQTALAKPGLSSRYATKARLALAQLLRKEGRLKQSLRHAVNAFVLGNDPVYTPEAMLLAVELLVETDKVQEAKTTWTELEARFPIFAQENRDNPAVKKLN